MPATGGTVVTKRINRIEMTPPEQDPWRYYPDDGPIEDLLERSIVAMEQALGGRAGQRCFEGTARYDSLSLMGPPGRLQGGLHCVGRLFPILHRIPDHTPEYPCAFFARLGRVINLQEDVPFEARFGREPSGRWWLSTRFGGTERLDAAVWQPRHTHTLQPVHWSALKDRYLAARESSERGQLSMMGLRLESIDDLFWSVIQPEQHRDPGAGLARFLTAPDEFGLAFVCYYLDAVGALSQVYLRGVPHFTTQLALTLATPRIPADEPLLIIADRRTTRPFPLSSARPVEVQGTAYGTTIGEILLADPDFSRIWAHGWLAAHPMDVAKIGPAFERLAEMQQSLAGG